MMEDNGFKKRFENAVLRHAVLREKCADIFERYNHLVTTEGKSLACQYMMEIGQHELREFELTVELRRWRRRVELRQMAINLGREPNLVEIESCLYAEFAEYQKQIARYVREIENARLYATAPKLTEAQTTRMRVLYLNAAKRLHPDANPNLTDVAKRLWVQIGEAYKARDWPELEYLCGIVGEVVGEEVTYAETAEGLVYLERENARLESVCSQQQEKIGELHLKVPWKYEEFLSDNDAVVARRAELLESIRSISEQIEAVRECWEKEVEV